MYDVIIIGKGPAGISAALYLKRSGLSICVIGKDLGALEKSSYVENYYGFPEKILGSKIIENGILQAENLGIEVCTNEVLTIEKDEFFTIKTTSSQYQSRAVFLATGKSRIKIKAKGFDQFVGAGISFCAVCDGFFFRDKKIAVVGSSDYALHELECLTKFSKDITLFTNGNTPPISPVLDGICVVSEPITEFCGDTKVNSIRTEKDTYPVDGVFVAIGTASATDFAYKIGVFTNQNNIEVDENFATNVQGLYAGGDCIGGFLQIAKAVSDGANASTAMIKYLKNNK